MRTACFGLILMAGLSVPVAASAADNTVLGVGTGAVAGAVVGGPIGAVVGAVAGGFIGANTRSTRPRSARRVRAAGRRAASRATPTRARLAAGDRFADRAGPTVPAPVASEVSTRARSDAAPAARPSPASGWQDPH